MTHVSRDCPHQIEEALAMYQKDREQFQRREQRFNNFYRPGVGQQMRNNFHNHHYEALVSQGPSPSAEESALEIILRRLNETSTETK